MACIMMSVLQEVNYIHVYFPGGRPASMQSFRLSLDMPTCICTRSEENFRSSTAVVIEVHFFMKKMKMNTANCENHVFLYFVPRAIFS